VAVKLVAAHLIKKKENFFAKILFALALQSIDA
jgi:hypothetical protein